MRRTRVTAGVTSAAIATFALFTTFALTACQSAATTAAAGPSTSASPIASAGTGPGSSPSAEASFGAGTGKSWNYTITSLTNTTSPDATLSVQYPVVTFTTLTPADTVLAATVNTKFKNVDEAFVSLFRTQFLNPNPVTAKGAIVPSKLQVTAYANRIGDVLSVRYDAFFDRSGGATGLSEEQVLSVRMDTGATLGPTDLLAPAAFSGAGQTQLAALIAPSLGSDFIFGGQSAQSAVHNALATLSMLTNGMSDPVISITPAGLEFTFQQGAITPMSNGTPVIVVPFAKLGSLVNPTLKTLVGA